VDATHEEIGNAELCDGGDRLVEDEQSVQQEVVSL
jgi:hypothetical protein